jgi:hypothetical protein
MRESAIYQAWQAEGKLRGRQVEGRSLTLRLLPRRVGTVPARTLTQIKRDRWIS